MKKIFALFIFVLSFANVFSQNKDFTILKEVKTTSVKNQAHSGTCWCFATVSFLESELLRQGKGEFDLSEMFIVRNVYKKKMATHIRMAGENFFTPGGQAHDVLNAINEFGVVPENVYSGRTLNEENHEHKELDAVAESLAKTWSEKSDDELKRWDKTFDAILDVYLGKKPEEFEYKGKKYTPKTFAKEVLTLNPDDYVEISSYGFHPFYKPFCLQTRYNWAMGIYYNVPVDDFMAIIDNALNNGCSIDWDGDVREKTFSFRKDGMATAVECNDDASCVSQETRDETYNNLTTTVDHLMHIVGIAKNSSGKKFYLTKNSWGTDNKYEGYMYLSEAYVKLKTVAFLVHKDAIPLEIAKKLGFK